MLPGTWQRRRGWSTHANGICPGAETSAGPRFTRPSLTSLARVSLPQDDDAGSDDEDQLQAKISEEYNAFVLEQKLRQESLRATRPWSAPPLMSPRPDTQRARKAEAEALAANSEGTDSWPISVSVPSVRACSARPVRKKAGPTQHRSTACVSQSCCTFALDRACVSARVFSQRCKSRPHSLGQSTSRLNSGRA